MEIYLLYILALLFQCCSSSFVPPGPRPRRPGSGPPRGGKSCKGKGRPGYIRTPLERNTVTPTNQSIVARAGKEPLSEFQNGIVYIMTIDVGSPKQTMRVIVDTGSWELFLNPNCAHAADQTYCLNAGHFEPTKSSTSKNLATRYSVAFGTGTFTGGYYSDTLWFGNNLWPVSTLRFGVSNDSDYVWAGILGLGYGSRFNTNYPTMIDLLVSEGYISVPMFSLYVGSQGSGAGEIVVGGVDTHKYSGWLEPINLYPPPDVQKATWKQASYWVNLTSFGYTPPGGNAKNLTRPDFSRIMMIDTGSTYSYIDADLVASLAQQFAATIDSTGVYWVNCKYKTMAGSVQFGFNNGAMIINTKYSDFVIDFGGGRCALGVQPADVGVNTWVLGDTFIRSAYIVFDQYYDAIWLANYAPCGSPVVTDLTKDAGNQLWLDLYGGC